MSSTRALLLAAAAVAGFSSTVGSAEALTPLSMDLAVDPSVTEGPSTYSTAAPSTFARPSDSAYEPTARITNRRARLQCVPFARRESGVEIYGNANTWWRQAAGRYETTQEPQEQAVMVLEGYNTTARGHVAVVREVVSPRLIIVDHSNWLNNGEITRDVPIRDVSVAGDWSEVQVWHIPGRQWGARSYNVQGFILNMLTDAKAQAEAEAKQQSEETVTVPVS
jgi:surface antigen